MTNRSTLMPTEPDLSAITTRAALKQWERATKQRLRDEYDQRIRDLEQAVNRRMRELPDDLQRTDYP